MVSVDPIRNIAPSHLSSLSEGVNDITRFSPTAENAHDLLRMCSLLKIKVRLEGPKGQRVQGNIESSKAISPEQTEIQITDHSFTFKEGDEVSISFELFHEFHLARTSVVQAAKNILTIANPNNVYRIHHRILDRSPLNPEERIAVRLREVTGRRSLTGEVFDLSSRGLGLIVRPRGNDSILRALELDKNVIVEPTIPMLKNVNAVPAKIVHWDRNEQTLRLGIACTIPLALGDEHSLEDFLLERKYPNVVRAMSDEDYREVWRLLNLSFQTIDAAPDESRRETSVVTWKKASWSSRPINRIYVLQKPSEDGSTIERVGTIATSRYYHKTWLIHQLGVDGTKGQVLSHQLYGRVVDYLRQTDEVKYVFGTFPKELHVFQKYYIEFIRNDPESHFHYLEETNILEFDVEKASRDLSAPAKDSVSVVPLETRHQAGVMKELRRRYPEMFLDAMDLREYDLQLSDAAALYSRVALQRERRIVVAEKNSKMLGFAVVEWGSEDQNVFSLFDNFRLFLMDETAEDAQMVKRALLRKTFEIFNENHVRVAISWTKDQTLLELVPSGKIFYEVYFWIADHSRMRPFLRHLDRLHGRVQAVRGARKNRTGDAS